MKFSTESVVSYYYTLILYIVVMLPHFILFICYISVRNNIYSYNLSHITILLSKIDKLERKKELIIYI